MLDDKKNTVWNQQVSAVRQIQEGIVSLDKSIKELQSKIESEGVSGDYSINHDCLRYSLKIWRSCIRLHELKKLQYELEGKDSFGLLKNPICGEE